MAIAKKRLISIMLIVTVPCCHTAFALQMCLCAQCTCLVYVVYVHKQQRAVKDVLSGPRVSR